MVRPCSSRRSRLYIVGPIALRTITCRGSSCECKYTSLFRFVAAGVAVLVIFVAMFTVSLAPLLIFFCHCHRKVHCIRARLPNLVREAVELDRSLPTSDVFSFPESMVSSSTPSTCSSSASYSPLGLTRAFTPQTGPSGVPCHCAAKPDWAIVFLKAYTYIGIFTLRFLWRVFRIRLRPKRDS